MGRKTKDEQEAAAVRALLQRVPWWGCLLAMAVLFALLRWAIPVLLETEVVAKPEPNRVDGRFVGSILQNGAARASYFVAPFLTLVLGAGWLLAKLQVWADNSPER